MADAASYGRTAETASLPIGHLYTLGFPLIDWFQEGLQDPLGIFSNPVDMADERERSKYWKGCFWPALEG